MAREYKVSKAFLSTVSKEDKTPQVVQTKGGNMHKYIVQVEDQPVEGWLQILKKPGNEVKVGDVLYGDIVENNWGKPQFNRAQRPEGSYGGGQAQPARQQPQASGNASHIEQKLDYIIRILESARWFVNPDQNVPLGQEGPKQADVVLDDIDDKPVDLSELDY